MDLLQIIGVFGVFYKVCPDFSVEFGFENPKAKTRFYEDTRILEIKRLEQEQMTKQDLTKNIYGGL
jgi:hypothetical protein